MLVKESSRPLRKPSVSIDHWRTDYRLVPLPLKVVNGYIVWCEDSFAHRDADAVNEVIAMVPPSLELPP